MDDKTSGLILSRLDGIIKLMVFRMTEGKKQVDQIVLLSKAGFAPKAIAEAIGTTANTVRVTLTSLKKQINGNRRRRKRR